MWRIAPNCREYAGNGRETPGKIPAQTVRVMFAARIMEKPMNEPLLSHHPLPWVVDHITDHAYENSRRYELLDADGWVILSGYHPDLLHFIAGTTCYFGLLERLCQQVRETGGLSTGHADTPEQLMAEVLEQVRELRDKLKEATRPHETGRE